jgi:hypothetical protein
VYRGEELVMHMQRHREHTRFTWKDWRVAIRVTGLVARRLDIVRQCHPLHTKCTLSLQPLMFGIL